MAWRGGDAESPLDDERQVAHDQSDREDDPAIEQAALLWP